MQLIKRLSATPPLQARNEDATLPTALDPRSSLQANKATFFFRLERELEKVNTFYLQKEAEESPQEAQTVVLSKLAMSTLFITLEEGFQHFGDDLNKLQQFVEINATGFSKILKKWDKTSKSRTKELYLSRAVDVQPCFNRDVISELSDQATTSLLELGALGEGEKLNFDDRLPNQVVSVQPIGVDESDIDSQLLSAATSGSPVTLQDWIVRLGKSPATADLVTRTFLAAITDAPTESLTILLECGSVNLSAEDEINARNCLHEAAICGNTFVLRTGLAANVDATRGDVYGRIPLHYACMHGRVEMVDALINSHAETINFRDHDNFTPLIHAVVHEQIDCVRHLLSYSVQIDPASESDHVPLNLACQHGLVAAAELLLQKGAKIMHDAEGLLPQHLVARSGQDPQLLLLLRRFGADLDEADRFNMWTPLFHAASEGNVDCLQTLLSIEARVDILDEKKLSAMYYAAWEGHLECMRLLGTSGGKTGVSPQFIPTQKQISSDQISELGTSNPDGIPDLSLPPPFIPLRRYGHNFLDSKTFIQLSFEEVGSNPVVFYHSNRFPAARLTITSKQSDLIPRNILLPIQEETRLMSFQIDNLATFAIDFEIYPTFGAKVIARTVALSSVFSPSSSSSGHCCLPLFDPRLRAIGQISFSFQIIKPFRGLSLEMTEFATYWKASGHLDTEPNTLITESSLAGDYVRLFVQLTNDLVPVLWPQWTISYAGLDLPINKLTGEQFRTITSGNTGQHGTWTEQRTTDLAQVHRSLASTGSTLRDVLNRLPVHVHVDLHVVYPTADQESSLGLGPTVNMNEFIDAILAEVFAHARNSNDDSPDAMRSMVFSSYNPDVCNALNWKQPNCELSDPTTSDKAYDFQTLCSCAMIWAQKKNARRDSKAA
ncbi:MAG: phosphate system positive regulatory protein pho81 [Piccolia ochrophora]|nr:MAG: phosphate system positive regulatory protein pho81 [Piccolia ochrophora]